MATNLSEFLKSIRPAVPMCPATIMEKGLIKAIQEFCRRTQILKRSFEVDVETTDVTAADNDAADLDLSTLFPDYRPIRVLQIKQDNTPYTPEHLVVETDLADFARHYDITTKKYYNFSGEQTIKIFPFDIDDTVTLFLEVVFKPLDAATSVDDFFYMEWLDVLVDGALWYLMDMDKQPWTNKPEAAKRRRFFNAGIGRASLSGQRIENERGRAVRLAMDF